MRELSLHILDIVQNSIAAEAELIKIIIKEDHTRDLFKITVLDDGRGMDQQQQKNVVDPFVTSRKTREVGLGLAFLKKAAQNCQGKLDLKSNPGEGTEVIAQFKDSHIDRAPLGNIASTITSLITTNPTVDFIYCHIVDAQKFELNTRTIKRELDDVAINNNKILKWIESYIKKNIDKLRKR
jgi:hypothetical protein